MITVIVPTYQPHDYLFSCLESLKNQSIETKFEIIIVLNGAKEPYYNTIQKYIAELNLGKQCRLLYTEKKGVSFARNEAIDFAKGDYIIFIDDDDLISPNYLSGLLECANENTIVLSRERTFYDNSSIIEEGYLSKKISELNNDDCFSLFNYRSFLSTACFKIIPINVIGNRRFNTHFVNGEDALFMALISDRIKSMVVAEKNDVIYYRRVRENSASQVKRSFCSKLSNSLNLFFAYLKIYLSSPIRYNFMFFSSRFIAVFKILFIKEF